jgi:hypothetical protein
MNKQTKEELAKSELSVLSVLRDRLNTAITLYAITDDDINNTQVFDKARALAKKVICTTTYFFILISFATSGLAAETSEEIKKIDSRLEELKTIYYQEQAIINGYTKNRTVPVREGSKEYLACLNASKRIEQAQTEAAALKRKRAEVNDGLANNPARKSPENLEANDRDSKPAQDIAQKDTQKPVEIREFEFEKVKSKGDAKKQSTLVFKGFYLGMPGEDAQGLLNHYLKLPQATSNPLKRVNPGLFGAPDEGPYCIVTDEEGRYVAKRNSMDHFALLDEQGAVKEFFVSAEIRDVLFDSKETPLDEFMQTFIDQYGLPELDQTLEIIKILNQDIGIQTFFVHRSPKGYELKFFGKLIPNPGRDKLTDGDVGGFSVKPIKTEEQRNKKFD